jgi:hypothetical protein
MAEVPPDRDTARARLEEAVTALGAETTDPRLVSGVDLYLPILLARRIEERNTEADLLERLSGCTLQLDRYDAGWGALGSLGLVEGRN